VTLSTLYNVLGACAVAITLCGSLLTWVIVLNVEVVSERVMSYYESRAWLNMELLKLKQKEFTVIWGDGGCDNDVRCEEE